MLVLKIVGEEKEHNKHGRFFKRKRKVELNCNIIRKNIAINGKLIMILEIPFSMMYDENVEKLLKIYKGRVLVGEKYSDLDFYNEYLFSAKKYYQRAILSSVVNQIKANSKEWKDIGIELGEFYICNEFYEIVRNFKSVTLITGRNIYLEKFIDDCYYEFGAIVAVKDDREIYRDKYAVYLNLDDVDAKGKLIINVNGKPSLLYPDASYFSAKEEYSKLEEFEINSDLICAAFSGE